MYFIRDQADGDFAAVHDLVAAAFRFMPYAAGTEQFIMDALWRNGVTTVALVAEDEGAIVGQAAFSKVTVGGRDVGWHGLGPVSVLPERQRHGIGKAMILEGLERLRILGSQGCAVVGDPGYYSRFGFHQTSEMHEPGVPAPYFMVLPFRHHLPVGAVGFDQAFQVKVPV